MKKAVVIVLGLLVMLTGCANQSYLKTNTHFKPVGWKRIAVLPFTGKGQYVDLATSTFTLQMVDQQSFILVQPEETRVKLTQVGMSIERNMLSVSEAQKVGQVFNAQGILIGNIDSYNNGMTLNAFATIKLVDAETGQIVAAAHQPSGLLFAYSEQQCVIAAIENVANDINHILGDLAKSNSVTLEIPTAATKAVNPI